MDGEWPRGRLAPREEVAQARRGRGSDRHACGRRSPPSGPPAATTRWRRRITPGPGIEQQPGLAPFDQVTRRRPVRVRRGRAAPEHGQAKPIGVARAHRRHAMAAGRREADTPLTAALSARGHPGPMAMVGRFRAGLRWHDHARQPPHRRLARADPVLRGSRRRCPRAGGRRHALPAVPARRGDLPRRRSGRRPVHHRVGRGEDRAAVGGRRGGDPRPAAARATCSGSWPCSTAPHGPRPRPH